MSQGPLCQNLTKNIQKEVSQIANHNLPCPILLGGLSVNLNHLKMGKMAIVPQKYVLEQNFLINDPSPKVWVSGFWLFTEMKNWCQPLWKMVKIAIAPQKYMRAKLPIINLPPKVYILPHRSSMYNFTLPNISNCSNKEIGWTNVLNLQFISN